MVISFYFITVAIITQPTNVIVPSGGTARFSCIVSIGRQFGGVTTDNVKWDDINMGNAITHRSRDPYMVENDFENVGQDLQLTSTLTITNVNTQHAGLYQFVLSLNGGDVMSWEASLTVLTGITNFIFAFYSYGNVPGVKCVCLLLYSL